MVVEKTGQMKVSYKKLRIMLVERAMTKTDLKEKIGVSSTTMAALNADRNVSLAVLLKICEFFQCDIGDIMEVVKN